MQCSEYTIGYNVMVIAAFEKRVGKKAREYEQQSKKLLLSGDTCSFKHFHSHHFGFGCCAWAENVP